MGVRTTAGRLAFTHAAHPAPPRMSDLEALLGTPFAEFALLFGLSALAGGIAIRLRQPLLVAFIAVGIVAGPAVLGLVRTHEQVGLLAQIGITILLFAVGLKLDVSHLRHIGPVALGAGLGQIAFTVGVGYALALGLELDWLTALYVAVALTFSSTIIVVKLLSDRRDLDSLHGRIAVGILIVQDIAVVVAMMAMSALRGPGIPTGADVLLGLAARIAGAAVLTYLAMRWVLPRALRTLARSQELLLIFAIAWGTALAALGEVMGFSKEAGAFLAGFSLASTAYRDAIGARLTSIRDFLLLFFFLDLGANLDLTLMGDAVLPAVLLALFVLLAKPLIVMAIMGFMGYRRRTGFLTGVTLAQISEFSIVFVAMGIGLGHIGPEVLGLTTLVGLITITLSTYLILYAQPLYEILERALAPFERRRPHRELKVERRRHKMEHPEAVIIGLGRYGGRLAERLQARGIRVLGVDFDPETVRAMRRAGLPVIFGDGESPDLVEGLPLDQAQWVVSTVRDEQANRAILAALTARRFAGHVAIVSNGLGPDDAESLDPRVRVLYPFRDAADYAALDLAARIVGATQADATPAPHAAREESAAKPSRA